jgi:predicted  nucleic acid-binding Zn-ribbon protein
MTTDPEPPAEEQAQGQKQELKSFAHLWADHRKIVEQSFPKREFPEITEEVKLQLTTAFFNAQIAVINTQMLGQALGLPEKQQLVHALNEANERGARVQNKLDRVEAAYAQLQKSAQGLVGRGSR